jgi:hypothetical protein
MSDDPRELPSWYHDAHRDARTGIGHDLQAYYELPSDTPKWMCALIARLDKRQEQKR